MIEKMIIAENTYIGNKRMELVLSLTLSFILMRFWSSPLPSPLGLSDDACMTNAHRREEKKGKKREERKIQLPGLLKNRAQAGVRLWYNLSARSGARQQPSTSVVPPAR